MSHNNQRISGLSATASAAFLADPDYAERIIVEQPGRETDDDIVDVVVNGLQYQMPEMADGTELDVELVEFIDPKKQNTIRKALVTMQVVDGQVQPKAEYYPANMLGVVAIQDDIPTKQFKARFELVPGKYRGQSWVAHLSA